VVDATSGRRIPVIQTLALPASPYQHGPAEADDMFVDADRRLKPAHLAGRAPDFQFAWVVR
jgi:hypothetical protein